jgi:SAM-dependent methyltransferase
VIGRSGLKRSRGGLVRRWLTDALGDALAGGGTTGSEAAARAHADALADRARAAIPARTIDAAQIHADELDINDGRKDYWEHIFANPDPWSYDTPYEAEKYERTMALVRREPVRSALELACAEGHFTRRLAGAVDRLLATDISENALSRAQERCSEHANIDYRQLDFFDGEIPGGHDLILCSEVLYFAPDDAKLDHIAGKIAAALADEGRLVTAHAHVLADDPAHTGFDWGDQFGVTRINAAFERAGLVLEAQQRTELYRVSAYRRTTRAIEPEIVDLPMTDDLEIELRRFILFGGAAVLRSDVADERALRIPILCLPGIRTDADIEQLRVVLRYLRAHGYSGLRLRDLARMQRDARAAQGRPIAIVVSDVDPSMALNTVMPLFQAHDLHATFGLSVKQALDTDPGEAIAGTVANGFDWAIVADEAADAVEIQVSLDLLATARGRLSAWQGGGDVAALIEDWAEDPRFQSLVTQAGFAPVIGPAPGFLDLERNETVWRRIALDAEDGTGMLCEKLRRDRSSDIQ